MFESKLSEDGFALSPSEKISIPTKATIKSKSTLQEHLIDANEAHRELYELELANDIILEELQPLSTASKSSKKRKKSFSGAITFLLYIGGGVPLFPSSLTCVPQERPLIGCSDLHHTR